MNQEIRVSETELYLLAAEEVMENLPLTNKEFYPKTKDECIDKLMEIVANKGLTIDWIKAVAEANISNKYTAIDCSNEWQWSFLGGMNKAKHTREEFVEKIASIQKGLKEKKIIVSDKYGKRYFTDGEK